MPKTIFDKIWDAHVVEELPGGRNIIYVDRHLIHEVTSPQAFDGLRLRGLKVRCPEKTFATEDHNVPTNAERLELPSKWSKSDSSIQVQALRKNCEEFGIQIWPLNSEYQGIVHVMGPELGLIMPGMTTVCGDSHTSTHGAFGTFSLGIGTTEIEMVLASQCLILEKPKTFELRVDGTLNAGVTAKDVVLHLIRDNGVGGGKGHVFLYTGSTFKSMSMEERMTVCNMSIEGGARAGLVEPDEKAVEFLRGKKFVPQGAEFDRAAEAWLTLNTDEDAKVDKLKKYKAGDIPPTVTWGTNPGMGIGLEEPIPLGDGTSYARAHEYMGVKPGQKLQDLKVDVVFIGSCTNSRISDLETAARIVKGKKIQKGIRGYVVPGSQQVKMEAEKRGLDKTFSDAGFEWRGAGCSMCIAMNGDQLKPGERSATTSNRNFEGRQGRGGRSHLCSPTVAASVAVLGRFPTLGELTEIVAGKC